MDEDIEEIDHDDLLNVNYSIFSTELYNSIYAIIKEKNYTIKEKNLGSASTLSSDEKTLQVGIAGLQLTMFYDNDFNIFIMTMAVTINGVISRCYRVDIGFGIEPFERFINKIEHYV